MKRYTEAEYIVSLVQQDIGLITIGVDLAKDLHKAKLNLGISIRSECKEEDEEKVKFYTKALLLFDIIYATMTGAEQ